MHLFHIACLSRSSTKSKEKTRRRLSLQGTRKACFQVSDRSPGISRIA